MNSFGQNGIFYSLEDALEAPEEVISLDLTRQGLITLPVNMSQFEHLKSLYLDDNQLK